jgi:prepilin-type processing-associated H-X9-DG protein
VGYIIAGLTVLVALSCGGGLVLIEIPLVLAFGWLGFLTKVVINAELSWPGLLTGAVWLAVMVGLGHLTARWLWASVRPEAAPWKLRRTAMVALTVIVLFVAGMAATGVAHQAVWLARSDAPWITASRRPAVDRAKCASNLRQIGQAIELYAKENGNRFPPNLKELLRTQDISPELMTCAASDDVTATGNSPEQVLADFDDPVGHHCSYVYFGRGLTWPAGADVPIASEPLSNHDGKGANILFGDGHVEFYEPDEVERILRYIPRPPTSRPSTNP